MMSAYRITSRAGFSLDQPALHEDVYAGKELLFDMGHGR